VSVARQAERKNAGNEAHRRPYESRSEPPASHGGYVGGILEAVSIPAPPQRPGPHHSALFVPITFGARPELGQRPQIQTEREYVQEVIDFRPSRNGQEDPLQFGSIVSRRPETEHRRYKDHSGYKRTIASTTAE
jgi:hypothetical protein